MSYVGNTPTTAAFPFDQFSGDGSTTAFTLSYAPAGTTSIIVSISGVVQNPNTYSVSGTTLTFTPAPPTGTNNIAVLYLGLPVVATLSPGNTAYFSSSVFTATAGQTVFTPSGTYQTGFINVIRNGSQLAPADYTATNGTTVTLANACTAGDTVVIEVFNLTSIAGALPVTGGTVTGATTFNSTLSVNGANVSGFTGFKNRIINGAMVIDQRNAGALLANPNGAYTLDRWLVYESTDGVISVQQVTDAPAGFSYSLKATTTTADASIGATQYAYLEHRIEGYNFYDLAFGTASAQNVTLSFQIKSSLTGTFGGVLMNSANNRCYPFTYTINAANTWESKSITVAGDTTGTWLTTNGIGIRVVFGWGIGSSYSGTAGAWTGAELYSPTGAVPLVGTLNATWQITGVQLEPGTTSTSYEFRSYGQELALCYRYYQKVSGGASDAFAMGSPYNTTACYGVYYFKVSMRTDPTGTASATNSLSFLSNNTANTATNVQFQLSSENQIEVETTHTGLTAAASGWWRFNGAGWVAFSAEL